MLKEDIKVIDGITYKKSTVDSYSIHFNDDNDRWRCMWAIINIDSDTWTFSATSDCGNYSYRWSYEKNRNFKKFLTGLDRSYFLSKISDETEVDEKESIKRMKEYCLEQRRGGTLDKTEAREIYNHIVDLENGNYDDDFEHGVYYTLGYDYLDFIIKTYPNGAITFHDVVFKKLIDILQKEIN